MKIPALAVALFLLAALVVSATSGPAGANAQTGSCQPNPAPVNASDPSVVVSSPTVGASVTSPLHVEGKARVFEATVSLTLFNANGTKIVSTTTNAAEGQVLSNFSTDVAFTVTSDTPACLWVFESSARDGSPTNVVQVPLTLRSGRLPATGTGTGDSDWAHAWMAIGFVFAGMGLIGFGRRLAKGLT